LSILSLNKSGNQTAFLTSIAAPDNEMSRIVQGMMVILPVPNSSFPAFWDTHLVARR